MAAFKRFRLFHWLLAGFFVAVYLSGDDAELLHVWLGYGLVALLVLRLLVRHCVRAVSAAAASQAAAAQTNRPRSVVG